MLALIAVSPWHWIAFIACVIVFLALDLGLLHRKAHVVGVKEALIWTGVWFTLAMVFALGIRHLGTPKDSLEFVTGYLIELSLSMDNVFVIALIFTYFKVPSQFQHRVLFWGILGVIVDAFYKLQAWIFGQGTDALTVVCKVAVDMLVFSPLFALPLICVCFNWKDHGFDVARARAGLGRGWYQVRVWPTVIAAWIVWIPAVALVYALPLALQFPIQNIIECMWVMTLLFLTRPESAEINNASS